MACAFGENFDLAAPSTIVRFGRIYGRAGVTRDFRDSAPGTEPAAPCVDAAGSERFAVRRQAPPRDRKPPTNATTNNTIATQNRSRAPSIAVPATPPKPNAAVTGPIIRNSTAQ